MEKNPDLGSRMNIPDYISESLETISALKILKSLMWNRIWDLVDPRFGIWDRKNSIRDPE
jgi:hypothetical protein